MTKFVAFVSGKGGVGKTTTTLNVGQALTNLGKKVVLLDANLVTPNLAILLGFMNPSGGTLNNFLRKEKNLRDVTYLHEGGLSIIPASPSYQEYQKTNPQKLTEVFEHLDNTADFVLVDAPSGLGFEVNHVLKNTDEAVVVVTPNLSSVVEGLKTIELAQAHNNIIAGIILNLTHKGKNELKPEEVEQYLGHRIIANIRDDKKIRKSVHRQMPLSSMYRFSRSVRQFKKVAEYISLENTSRIE